MFKDFDSWFTNKINYNLLYNIRHVLYYISVWIFITLFFVYIKFHDIPQDYLTEIYHLDSTISKEWMYKTSLQIGLFFGLSLGMLHVFVYPFMERNWKLLWNVCFRVSVFLLLSISVYFILLYTHGVKINSTLILQTFTHSSILNIVLYAFTTEIIVGLIVLLRRNLGRKYFVNLLKNTYRNPKEEERVFMFLDLEDSTVTANKIGHLNFSRFIQDCFWDLSDVVLKYDAEIYQFVGDEAVITWKVSKNFDYERCIDLYFSYKKLLEKKQKAYLEKYGVAPYFTCAIHSGTVSAAIVGNYKKEIAYHGNVLNLGACLQKICKELQTPVLISNHFFTHLKNPYYTLTPTKLENLKGVYDSQWVYKVTKDYKKIQFYS